MMSLNLEAYTIWLTTQKVMWMSTVPLMRRYKTYIDPFKNYLHLSAKLYTDPLYRNVPLLLGNKPEQVFNSRYFIFVVPTTSKVYWGIGLMDLCDEHVITTELIYDTTKEE